MANIEFSVSQALSESWALFKKNWLGLVVTYLIFSIALSVIGYGLFFLCAYLFVPDALQSYVAAVQSGNEALMQQSQLAMQWAGQPAFNLVSIVLTSIFLVGFIGNCLAMVRGTSNGIDGSCFNRPFSLYCKLLCLQFITSILSVIGLLCCIVPGIYLMVKLSFVTTYQIDHPDKGIVESIKGGWALTNGNFGNILLLILAEVGVMILGYCCCCIGMFAAVPICYLAVTSAYNTLLANVEPVVVAEATPVNADNYSKQE